MITWHPNPFGLHARMPLNAYNNHLANSLGSSRNLATSTKLTAGTLTATDTADFGTRTKMNRPPGRDDDYPHTLFLRAAYNITGATRRLGEYIAAQ
jgi:hypothetical protein